MITRDGATTSLWQETAGPYKIQNSPSSGTKYDVIIVGAGITGISTALLLQEKGMKCLILEAAEPGFGTTGGTTAHLNTLLDTPYTTIIKNFGESNARKIAQATHEAIQSIKLNIRRLAIPCEFEECSAFLFSQDEKQTKELQEIYEACKRVGVNAYYANKIPVPIECDKAIEVSGQARFHPLRYIFGLAEAFELAGGMIKTNSRVTNFQEDKTGVIVETEGQRFHGSTLIFATHIPPFINILHMRCSPYRSYAMAVRLASGEYPQHLAYDMYDPYHYYRTQPIDGIPHLIVGGNDHKTAHETNTHACFLNLESHIRHHFDVAEITHSWSSQYYESTDGIPYIGSLPGHSEKVLVATGFGGNGMTYSAVAARVLVNIIHKKEDELISLFLPSRIKPIAGFKSFTEHNLDVIKQFTSKLFSAETLHEFADIAPGDSRIVKLDGQSVGIHKDEQGALHAVNAVCTHMKCTVAWNASEKSWDCPCHGARYSCDGKVLNGPASRDLDYINVELLALK